MHDWAAGNFLAWMEQAFVLASAGSLLLLASRIRHPWTKLGYCHALLLLCLALPWIQPWRHPSAAVQSGGGWLALPDARVILWLLLAGGVAKLAWLLAGLWRIRKYRISSMPMYPIPDSVRAASAVTHADALFCVSSEVPGPVMLGWLTPVVLLPESFLDLAEEAQCGVACHELLHVRRHDWLVTVLEELAGTLLWFNPAIWPLLAQARLAREQLVDAEVVRLTASREPYINALLAIARGGSQLDLAPAPLFLRRRHLTQRVHLLLKDTAMSNVRLVASYASITAMLALAGWFGVTSFPLIRREPGPIAAAPAASVVVAQVAPAAAPATTPQPKSTPEPAAIAESEGEPYLPSAPIPPDPRELVTGPVRALTSAAEEASARALMERALQNASLTTANTPPYRFDVSFTAAGDVMLAGPGQLTEIRMTGKRRWTADLADFSLIRWTISGRTVEDRRVAAIPTRVESLRDAIHWAFDWSLRGARIRSSAAKWNGRPATCLLFSKWTGEATRTQARLWEEDEYCIDNESGLLQVSSVAPGTYAVYEYGERLDFHGRSPADHISIYTAGAMVADARFTIADAAPSDLALLNFPAEAAANYPVVVLDPHARFQIRTPNPYSSKLVQPVIVHALIDGDGKVLEGEVSAAADPALARNALDLVKHRYLPHTALSQHEAYINVRFMPQ